METGLLIFYYGLKLGGLGLFNALLVIFQVFGFMKVRSQLVCLSPARREPLFLGEDVFSHVESRGN